MQSFQIVLQLLIRSVPGIFCEQISVPAHIIDFETTCMHTIDYKTSAEADESGRNDIGQRGLFAEGALLGITDSNGPTGRLVRGR